MKRELAITAVALMAILAGCKKAAESANETLIEKTIEAQTGGKADVDIKGDTVSIKTAEGEMNYSTGGNVKIPDAFPKDVLVYPGATVQHQMTTPDNMMVMLASKDALPKVAEAYKTKMAEDGWKQEMAMDSDGQTVLSFTKPDRTAGVIISADGTGSQINLSVTAKAAKTTGQD